VVFDSAATNLVKGDTNRERDVFIRDRSSGTTRRVSVGAGGSQARGYSGDPTISANGRYVAFESAAPNLVRGDTNGEWDVFVRDLVAKSTKRVSVSSGGDQARNGASLDGFISGDGRYVVFESGATNLVSGDTNRAVDVFRRGPLR
jgi:Tol biopolymer transport system component